MSEKKHRTGSNLARKTAARLSAVQAVYQMRAGGQPAREIVAEYRNYRFGKPVDGHHMVSPDEALFTAIVGGVETGMTDLTGIVEASMMRRESVSPFENLSSVEPLLAAILLCGVYELLAHHEIDAPVIIADYLDVTHAFYEGGESKLVNAVLDKARKGIRQPENEGQ